MNTTIATTTYEIQTISSAFAGRIPEHLWRTKAVARSLRGAYQAYAEQYRWYHPEPNCWSGHVRIVEQPSGRQVQITRISTVRGVRYQLDYLD